MMEIDDRGIERALGALQARVEAIEWRLSRAEDITAAQLTVITGKLDKIEAAISEDRGRREASATLMRYLQWLWGAVGGGALVAGVWQWLRR